MSQAKKKKSLMSRLKKWQKSYKIIFWNQNGTSIKIWRSKRNNNSFTTKMKFIHTLKTKMSNWYFFYCFCVLRHNFWFVSKKELILVRYNLFFFFFVFFFSYTASFVKVYFVFTSKEQRQQRGFRDSNSECVDVSIINRYGSFLILWPPFSYAFVYFFVFAAEFPILPRYKSCGVSLGCVVLGFIWIVGASMLDLELWCHSLFIWLGFAVSLPFCCWTVRLCLLYICLSMVEGSVNGDNCFREILSCLNWEAGCFMLFLHACFLA